MQTFSDAPRNETVGLRTNNWDGVSTSLRSALSQNRRTEAPRCGFQPPSRRSLQRATYPAEADALGVNLQPRLTARTSLVTMAKSVRRLDPRPRSNSLCVGLLTFNRHHDQGAGDLATQIDPMSDQPDALTVTVREMSTLAVVELIGELDVASVATLRETLLTLDLDGGINLAINLQGLSFLGSTGIGIIIAACKRVRAAGGSFSVWCDDGLTRRTLEIAGLEDYLELKDGEEDHPNQRGRPSLAD